MVKQEYKIGMFRMDDCTIIVTKDNNKWHLSISKRNESPTYAEIKRARYTYIPDDVYMAQIFPPKKEFINLHPFCYHLFEI